MPAWRAPAAMLGPATPANARSGALLAAVGRRQLRSLAAPLRPTGIAQTVYGRVKDVDRDGIVKIQTDRDSFKVRLAPEVAAQVREGDTVQLNMTILPPGTPAASPASR